MKAGSRSVRSTGMVDDGTEAVFDVCGLLEDETLITPEIEVVAITVELEEDVAVAVAGLVTPGPP